MWHQSGNLIDEMSEKGYFMVIEAGDARNTDKYAAKDLATKVGFLDGSEDSTKKIQSMLHWDVNNGIARRSWARNEEAIFAIKKEMERTPELKVTLPNIVDENLLDKVFFK